MIAAPDSTVLVVDDSPANLRLLEELLKGQGLSVRAAPTAAFALRAIAARKPDLVLCDVRLPDMDGFTLCRRLKDDSETRAIPVLFLSALNDTQDKLNGFAAGGVDYITKPFVPEEVLARVRTHLALSAMSRTLARQNDELRQHRDHLEVLVARRTAELQRSNADLEQFAYAVSHDLQEPLRTVSSFLGLLERRHGPDLSEDAREFIHFAVDGARRMTRLIQGLLEYSRVNTRGGAMAPVAMAEVVTIALQSLAGSISDSGAEITVPPDLPTVPGDEMQLVRVVQNLVGNAIKYRSPGRGARITLGWRRDDGEWVFSVSDTNDPIPPQHHQRIFQMFQRLHGPDIEGTGIGLAVCTRIIERHGGRIWIETSPGGNTFLFTLPAAANRHRGRSSPIAPLPHHPACGSAPGGSRD